MNQQMSGTAGMLCGLLIALPIVVIIGGFFLRVACWMCDAAVPPLPYAALVALLTWLMLAAVTYLAHSGLDFAAAEWHLTKPQLRGGAILLGFPLQLLVAAAMYSGLLKVSFGKGIIIRLAELLILVFVGVTVAVLLMVVRGGLGRLAI